ncbi:MAG TPA: hypothetical protein VE984_00700 [Gaiellaceae bacterium]|nr:hypothetical protein [Gaiellaceae bacterium]
MSSRRKLAALAAVLLVAAGATGAALASQGRSTVKPAPVPHLAGKSLIDAAAIYLGIPVARLKGDLRPGHPLAAVARSTPGRSVAGLRATLVYDAMTNLHRAQGALSRVRMRYAHAWLSRRIAGYVAGACPLSLHGMFVKLGGGCPGMKM